MPRPITRFFLPWLLLAPGLAGAHGVDPRVTAIAFPPQFPDSVWAVTDSQGLFARLKDGFTWLCEDALAPSAGLRTVAPLGAGQDRWLLATAQGLFLTTDRGCGSGRLEGPFTGHRPLGVWPHPVRLDEALVVTSTPELPNDVHLTEDAGATWRAAGLALPGVVREVVRAASDPERIYLAHAGGALRSDDGGRTFSPLPALGPPEASPDPRELHLLAVSPADPDVVFGALERLPATLVVRSADAGATWEVVAEVEDLGLQLALDRAGREGLLVSRFAGTLRSDDGGRSWTPVAEPVPTLGCLTLQPGSERLWACSHVFRGGPWVLAHSDDFGRTWAPAFRAFEEVESVWDCAPQSRARHCCQGLCPGQPIGTDCGGGAGNPAEDPLCQPVPVTPETDGGAGPADAGPRADGGPEADAAPVGDAGAPAASDAAPMADRGRPPPDDAQPDPPRRRSADDGCRQAPAAAPLPWLLLLLGCRRRRER